tara:strand:+ start:11 stop:1231 length:1221 start_codon:yes stop_codon:yes gene_type:complete
MRYEYYGGLDFGYREAKISIINSDKKVIYKSSNTYKSDFLNPQTWINSFEEIFMDVPEPLKNNLSRLSISGTTGTLLACKPNGHNLGDAFSYDLIISEKIKNIKFLCEEKPFLKIPQNSISKALILIDKYGEDILLRHQSDWISGWILNNWKYGEDSNNITLGWNIVTQSWQTIFNKTQLKRNLPLIVRTGVNLGKIYEPIAKKNNINSDLLVVSGTTNSNASFLGLQLQKQDALTVIGETTIFKKYLKKSVLSNSFAISKINGEWIYSGFSSLGYSNLLKIFSDIQIEELSKQINPRKRTNLDVLKINSDNKMYSRNKLFVRKRPVSDALFLHAFFEGLAKIELNNWEKIKQMTGSLPHKIFTIGSGSQNPQFRSIREKIIKIPIFNCSDRASYGSAIIALNANT